MSHIRASRPAQNTTLIGGSRLSQRTADIEMTGQRVDHGHICNQVGIGRDHDHSEADLQLILMPADREDDILLCRFDALGSALSFQRSSASNLVVAHTYQLGQGEQLMDVGNRPGVRRN